MDEKAKCSTILLFGQREQPPSAETSGGLKQVKDIVDSVLAKVGLKQKEDMMIDLHVSSTSISFNDNQFKLQDNFKNNHFPSQSLKINGLQACKFTSSD